MTMKVAGVFSSGYQIFRAYRLDEEHKEQSKGTKFGYRLVGPHSQEYHLMRVNGRPHLLIAMDMKKRTQPLQFNKVVFTDKDDDLRIAAGK